MKRIIFNGAGKVPETILEKFRELIYKNHNQYKFSEINVIEPKFIAEEKIYTEEFVYTLIFEPFVDQKYITILVSDYKERRAK